MRAAVIESNGSAKHMRTKEVDSPSIGPGDVLLRVRRAGICGSDLHGLLDHQDTSRASGLIMGHEITGDIVAVGAGVEGLAEGDRVAVDPQVRCGRCTACQRGWISICENKQGLGSSRRGVVHGGFAEYVRVGHEQIVPVPPEVSVEQAALIEPLGNGVHVRHRADPSPDDVVVVLGAGPLGLSIIQAFRAAGVTRLVATDLSDDKLSVAADLGASHTANGATGDLAGLVDELSHGAGADIVVEAVGVSATYQQAIEVARRRGTVMFFGSAVPTVELALIPILHKELSLIGCTGANDEWAEAVDLVARGVIDPTPLITHEFPLEQAQEAMDTLADPASGAIKVLLCP